MDREEYENVNDEESSKQEMSKELEEELSEKEERDESEEGSEYEEIDVTDNPLYQVLSAFFETEEGENICDILKQLTEVVKDNTKAMQKLLKHKK